MRAKSKLLFGLSSISLLNALSSSDKNHVPAKLANDNTDPSPHNTASSSSASSVLIHPRSPQTAWYGSRPQPNRVVDVEYFPDGNGEGYGRQPPTREEIAFFRGSSGAQRARLGAPGDGGFGFAGRPASWQEQQQQQYQSPAEVIEVFRGPPAEVDVYRGRQPVEVDVVESAVRPERLTAGYGERPSRPEKFFVPEHYRERPTFRYAEYFDKPFFWEHGCPRGDCAFEKFPFLEGARPFSYCEDRCWNNDCLGKNCAGCDRDCTNIFPGCEARCFSDECVLSGNCERSCWDCGRFMQYQWERNIMTLRERFDVRESPVIFERSFERCEKICKRPDPGCEVCFERPTYGCNTCLERPTSECEICVERETFREKEFYYSRHTHRQHQLPRPRPLNHTHHVPRPKLHVVRPDIKDCPGRGCEPEPEEEIVIEILPPEPPCYANFDPILNGDFEYPGQPFQSWQTSSPTGLTVAESPVAEANVTGITYHSAQFNLDYDGCSATLTQHSLQGLCPNQLYKLSFFMALDEVAATDNCQIEIRLARQVFWRHKLPYPNLLGAPMEVEKKLMSETAYHVEQNGTRVDGVDEGFQVGGPSDLEFMVECKNMTHTDIAHVWLDNIVLAPVILVP